MVTTKSELVTSIDAADGTVANRVDQDVLEGNTAIIESAASLTAADFDADGDVAHMLVLDSSVKVSSLMVFNTDMDTGTACVINIGCVAAVDFVDGTTEHSQYDILDEDCFVTLGTHFQAAALGGVDVRYETLALTTSDQELWEIAGLASDPQVPIGISIFQTATSADQQAGTVLLRAVVSKKHV